MSYTGEAEETQAQIDRREKAFGAKFIQKLCRHFWTRYEPGYQLDFRIVDTRTRFICSAELKSRSQPSDYYYFRQTYMLNNKKRIFAMEKHPGSILMVHFIPDDAVLWVPFDTPISHVEAKGGRKDRGREDDQQPQAHYFRRDFRDMREVNPFAWIRQQQLKDSE